MYRKVDDFIKDWNVSSAGTLKVIESLKDEKLDQAIVEGHNTLGWLSWHLVGAMGAYGHLVGFSLPAPSRHDAAPKTVANLKEAYEKCAAAVVEQATKLTDADLEKVVDGFVGPEAIGSILRNMIDHQTHHRGQMTVLLRQAALPVPPVMGPTKEMS